MLDRLMGRAVFAIPHGVVGKNEDGRQLHQSGEPDRRPRVVTEDEESRAKSAELRKREPVNGCSHGVLADTEMQILSTRTAGLEVARAFVSQSGLVRRPEIPRAAEEPGYVLRQHVQHFA